MAYRVAAAALASGQASGAPATAAAAPAAPWQLRAWRRLRFAHPFLLWALPALAAGPRLRRRYEAW